MRSVLGAASYAHLAPVLPDGSPHSTPVYAGTRGEDLKYPRDHERVVLVVEPEHQKVGMS